MGFGVGNLALVRGHPVLVLQHFVVAGVFEIVGSLVERLLRRHASFFVLHVLGGLELGRLSALDQRLGLVLVGLTPVLSLVGALTLCDGGGSIRLGVGVGLEFVNERSRVEGGHAALVIQVHVGGVGELCGQQTLLAVDDQVGGRLFPLSGIVCLCVLQMNLGDVALVDEHTNN